MATSLNPFGALGNHNPPHICDAHGRNVRYLRVSVTDRCNLHCLYCRSKAQQTFIPHETILRYEEIMRVVSAVHNLGVRKIRLTGGEPFARKGCDSFLAQLHQTFPDLDLRLTTNGTMLTPHVPLLKKIGVSAVNISLDSFDRETFLRITGHDLLSHVLEAIDALLASDIHVKLNAVGLRGINDHQMSDFMHAARTLPLDMRFIEFMPMGQETSWSESYFWSADAMYAEAERFVTLVPEATHTETQGPARMFRVLNGKGRVGFISPLSHHFCHSCNRLRLTSDGQLRTCLFADKEYTLRGMVRHPRVSEQALCRVILAACQTKPIGAELLAARQGRAVAQKAMVGIGG